MQRAEMEELRQRDANLTALQAIGPRKKPKLDTDATGSTAVSVHCASTNSNTTLYSSIIHRILHSNRLEERPPD